MPLTHTTEFCFLFWNARGLRLNFLEFKAFLAQHPVHAAFISETFLMAIHTQMMVPGFQVTRKDTLAPHSGGFACYLSDYFTPFFSPISLPSFSQLCIAYRVSFSNLHFTAIFVYLNPSLPPTIIDTLASILHSLPPPFLLFGDFNSHHPLWGSTRTCPRGKHLASLADDFGLVLLNDSTPTFLSSSYGTFSYLDLAFASPALAPLISWEVADDALGSDHLPCFLRLSVQTPAPSTNNSSQWLVKKANWPLFFHRADDLFSSFNSGADANVDFLCGRFCYAVIEAATASVPTRRAGGSRRPLVPWWSEDCSAAVKAKRSAYRVFRRNSTPFNLSTYKLLCARAKRTIRQARRASWRHFCGSINARTPLSDIWRRIRPLSFNSARSRTILPSLSLSDKATTLISHFCPPPATVFLSSPRAISISQSVSDFLNSPCPHSSTLCHPFSRSELDSALLALKDTAPGPDSIPSCFLRHLPDSGKESLLHLINSSWQQGELPSQWRSTLVVPIPKPNKPPADPSSYRPISLTSVPCKTMERMILSRLTWFLDSHTILSPFQNGFCKGRSTLHSHLLLDFDIRCAFNYRHHTIACFLDLEKAFDTVWHDGLLFKLSQLGIPTCVVKWLRSFLSNRTCRLKLDSFLSHPFSTTSGTPQGSVLSPTLFSLMVNDLPSCLPTGIRVSMYADDIAIWFSSRRIGTVLRKLQEALDSLSKWASDWGFSFSASKTIAVPFSLSLTHRTYSSLHLSINNSPIAFDSSFRFLGFSFDRRLSWKPRLQELTEAVLRRINLLRCISGLTWGADRKSLILLYRALIRPLFDYSSPLLLQASHTFTLSLERLQARCLRICCGLPRTVPSDTLCVESGIMPLSLRRKVLSSNFFLRTLASDSHSPLSTLFHLYSVDIFFHFRMNPPTWIFLARLLSDHLPALSSPEPPPSPPPIWSFAPPRVVFPTFSKSSLPDAQLRALFFESVHSDYFYYTQIFTDGSFNPNSGFSASSFWVPSSSFSFSERLPDHSGIFTAELYAILCAVNHVLSTNSSHTVIFSDSLNSLTTISQHSVNPFRRYLLEQLYVRLNSASERGLSVVLHWVPAHCGIDGNEAADRLASSPTSSSTFPFPPPFNYIASCFRDSITSEWQRDWDTSPHSRSFFGIKPTVAHWPHLSFGSRSLQTSIARLRVGHCFLREPRCRRNLTDDPLCPLCCCIQTISHFILHCPNLQPYRDLHLLPLLDNIPDATLTLPFLLSGGSPPFSHHAQVFSALHAYIRASGIFV